MPVESPEKEECDEESYGGPHWVVSEAPRGSALRIVHGVKNGGGRY